MRSAAPDAPVALLSAASSAESPASAMANTSSQMSRGVAVGLFSRPIDADCRRRTSLFRIFGFEA